MLDTNVLSEFVSLRPDAAVAAWLSAAAVGDLGMSVLSLGEVERGIGLLGSGARRERLIRWARHELPAQFGTRILSVDAPTATAWGQLSALGRKAGRPLPEVDGLLLATAQVHGLTLVTRNLRDCAGRGVPTLDPWAWPHV